MGISFEKSEISLEVIISKLCLFILLIFIIIYVLQNIVNKIKKIITINYDFFESNEEYQDIILANIH